MRTWARFDGALGLFLTGALLENLAATNAVRPPVEVAAAASIAAFAMQNGHIDSPLLSGLIGLLHRYTGAGRLGVRLNAGKHMRPTGTDAFLLLFGEHTERGVTEGEERAAILG